MQLKSAIEAVVFAAGRPVTAGELHDLARALIPDREVEGAEIKSALSELSQEWQSRQRGFVLEEVAGGYEFRSVPEYAPWIMLLNQSRPQRLSIPALESLAVIAYRQPVTRAELEALRGVDCAGVIKSLGDRGLLRVIGRKEEPGRPLLYGTTRAFLELFNLNDLGDLPPLKEFEERIKEKAQEPLVLSVADLASSPQDLMDLECSDREALEDLESTLADLKEVEKTYQEPVPPKDLDPKGLDPEGLEKTEVDVNPDRPGA